MFVPHDLSAIADAHNALARLSLIFRTPLREAAPFVVDLEQEAVVWAKERGGFGRRRRRGRRRRKARRRRKRSRAPDEQPPFALQDFTLSISRGTLATVVLRVGSGKSSLLKGLIGEMRSTDTGGK
jgi:ABC-type uncharacterized transport system ATPase subunit